MLANCQVIVVDFIAMCAVLGPLDFDGFCAGYLEHGAWLAARGEGRDTRLFAAIGQRTRRERPERASYAS